MRTLKVEEGAGAAAGLDDDFPCHRFRRPAGVAEHSIAKDRRSAHTVVLGPIPPVPLPAEGVGVMLAADEAWNAGADRVMAIACGATQIAHDDLGGVTRRDLELPATRRAGEIASGFRLHGRTLPGPSRPSRLTSPSTMRPARRVQVWVSTSARARAASRAALVGSRRSASIARVSTSDRSGS